MLVKAMLSKPLIISLFVSISLNCLFGYLSYSFYSDKAIAESQLTIAVKANKDLKESLDKKEAACKITDVIVSEYTREKQEIVKETNGVLGDIDRLPSVSVQVESKSKRQENANKQTEDALVSLDDKLSADLVRMLDEVCLRAKGSACDDA